MPTEAKLVFYLDAPTSDVAVAIIKAALRAFDESHPSVVESVAEGTWLTESKKMSIPVTVRCDSQSEALSFNTELNRLFAEQQKARGIHVAPAQSLLVDGTKRPESKARARLPRLAVVGFALAVIAGVVWFRSSGTGQSSVATGPVTVAEPKSPIATADPSPPPPAPTLNLTVITTDGAAHEIHNAEVTSGTDLNLPSWGFSSQEINSFVVLTDAERPREEHLFIRREVLEARKQTYHAMILPVNLIESIAATGTTIRSPEREDVQLDYGMRDYRQVSVTMRDGAVLRAVTSQSLQHFASSTYEFRVTGTEDLHDFGKAAFSNRVGDGSIRQITFPSMAPVPIAAKSPLAAVITEVGGRRITLSDLRLEGGDTLAMTKTGSTVEVSASNIRRIDLHQGLYDGNTNAIAPERIAISVVLNSGAEQDCEWKTTALIGKTPGGWYEWIPGAALKAIDFGAAREQNK